MSLIRKAEYLKRYKDLAWLLMKYGRSDLVDQMQLGDVVESTSQNEKAASKAEELPDDLEKLGPTFVKLGQFLSTRADFLPPEYLDALSRLQDNVAPISFEQVEEIVTEELGVRISKAFDSFDETPLASASVGQVHVATLRGGRPVAVKIQRPNIRKQIVQDLEAFEDIAEFLENHTDTGRDFMAHTTMVEFRKSMLRELDYTQEARNLVTLGENLQEFDRIVVPKPVEDYTTSRVLTMEYIRGKNVGKLSPLAVLELDGGVLAEELFRAYLQQILIDGFYHADPHPGNIFLTEDNCIALIDLGMAARIPDGLQTDLIRLLIAISEGHGGQAAKYALQIGTATERADEERFARQVTELVGKYHGSDLEQLQIGRLVLEVTKISGINGIRLPNSLVMLAKTLLNLDEVGRTLDPTFDPNASLRRNAAELVQKRMAESNSPGSLYELLLDTREFAEHLPGRLNKIMDTLANNELKVNATTIDERFLMAGLKEIANRLTLSVVLAALIVGAALLMRVDTAFKLFGYPGIAIVFFLLAGIAGLVMVGQIMFADKQPE